MGDGVASASVNAALWPLGVLLWLILPEERTAPSCAFSWPDRVHLQTPFRVVGAKYTPILPAFPQTAPRISRAGPTPVLGARVVWLRQSYSVRCLAARPPRFCVVALLRLLFSTSSGKALSCPGDPVSLHVLMVGRKKKRKRYEYYVEFRARFRGLVITGSRSVAVRHWTRANPVIFWRLSRLGFEDIEMKTASNIPPDRSQEKTWRHHFAGQTGRKRGNPKRQRTFIAFKVNKPHRLIRLAISALALAGPALVVIRLFARLRSVSK